MERDTLFEFPVWIVQYEMSKRQKEESDRTVDSFSSLVSCLTKFSRLYKGHRTLNEGGTILSNINIVCFTTTHFYTSCPQMRPELVPLLNSTFSVRDISPTKPWTGQTVKTMDGHFDFPFTSVTLKCWVLCRDFRKKTNYIKFVNLYKRYLKWRKVNGNLSSVTPLHKSSNTRYCLTWQPFQKNTERSSHMTTFLMTLNYHFTTFY